MGYGFENTEIGYLVNPEQLTPEQWADMRSSTELTPEKRLLLAVLDDAVRCYIEYGEGGKVCYRRSLFVEAELWIFSERPAKLPFWYVCTELGINPDWMRKKLEAARASGLRTIAYRESMTRNNHPMTALRERADAE